MELGLNGKKFKDMGLILKSAPDIQVPLKRVKESTVNNLDGRFIVEYDGYDAIDVKLEFHIDRTLDDANLKEIKQLFSQRNVVLNYFDTNMYRNAYISSVVDITQIINILGECVISLKCEPFMHPVDDVGEDVVIEYITDGSKPNMLGVHSGGYTTEAAVKEKWRGDSVNVSLDDELGQYVLNASEPWNAYDMPSTLTAPITAGKKYTVSLDIHAANPGAVQMSMYNINAGNPLHYNQDVAIKEVNKWHRVSYTFEAIDNSSDQLMFIYARGNTIKTTNFKVEEGDIATAWNNGTVPGVYMGALDYTMTGDVRTYPKFVCNIDSTKEAYLTLNGHKVEFMNYTGEITIDFDKGCAFTADGKRKYITTKGEFTPLQAGVNPITTIGLSSARVVEKPNMI